MSVAVEVKFSMKVMVNKQKTKVLFAEADSDFTDILLSFLTLPLGKIVRILKNHYRGNAPIIGSLTTLYNGIVILDRIHLWDSYVIWDKLLYPTSPYDAECCKLKVSVDNTQPTKYVKWVDRENKRKRCSNMHSYTTKGDSRKSLSKAIVASASKTQAADDGDGHVADDSDGDGDAGVFTRSTAYFMISDDLRIAPVVPGSILQTLINLGITDTDGAELRTVTLGFNEIMDLLKGSLISKTPLTDIILHKSSKTNCVTGDLLHMMKKRPSSKSKKMFVKAMVQKSTKKLLFVQAKEDFVNFLFSFLTIPLGGVECLLDSKTSLKNIDNLYRSIANINGDRYLKTKDTKNILLKPKPPPFYMSQNQILPYAEEGMSPSHQTRTWSSTFLFPRGTGNYVKGPAMYNVTDDLTVTPFCLTSSLSILNGLKIPLSDVKEMDLHIGVEEALSILKAALTSTFALTNGLTNLIIEKQQKQEQKQEHL